MSSHARSSFSTRDGEANELARHRRPGIWNNHVLGGFKYEQIKSVDVGGGIVGLILHSTTLYGQPEVETCRVHPDGRVQWGAAVE